MTLIHMDTESVRMLAKQMMQTVDAMQIQIDRLNGQVQSLDWVGKSGDEYRNEFSVLKRRLDERCVQCRILADRVQREVNEWMQVDQNGKDSFMVSPGFWAGVTATLREMVVILFPYTLKEAINEMLDSPAGRELIEYAIQNKVRFVTKDGVSYGYMGDDARIIEIDWGDGVGSARYGDGRIFVDDDFLTRRSLSREQLAALIGHEMQHAVDDKANQYYNSQQTEELNNYNHLAPNEQVAVRDELAKDIQSRVDSEIRAYERQDAILDNRSYQDDGINTGGERQGIFDQQLDTGTYESYYEKAYAERYPGLEFDFKIDDSGNVQVMILPAAPAAPVPAPVPTPLPA